MMRAITCLVALGVATALPMPFVGDSGSCSGTAVPTKTTPACYQGNASVLGGAFEEGVAISIDTFDHDTRKGTVHIDASGVEAKHCVGYSFTLATDGTIEFDKSHLISTCFGTFQIDSKYCSDQDTILLHVTIPHMPVAKLPVTLTSVACPTLVEEA